MEKMDDNDNDHKKINTKENIILSDNKLNLNKNELKFRFNILDNIKGILIFSVVFGHFLFNYSNKNKNSFSFKIVNFIYCFHMPSFIFWSGFLSKSENSRSFKNITKLLLIYIIFNFSHGFILYKYKNIKLQFYNPYHSYWYLLCLIYWRFTIKFISSQIFSIIISFLISFLIGFSGEINNIFSFNKAFAFFPYFIIGYKFSKNNLEKIIYFRKKFYLIIIISFSIFLFISLKICPFIGIKHTMMDNNYDAYREDITNRLLLFIFSFLMIIFSMLIISNKKIFLLTNTGKNSLYIYLFHRIFTIIIDNEIFSDFKYNQYIILYSLIFSILIQICFGSDLFSKRMNELIQYIYDNLYQVNKKGKIIWLIISLLFIRILLINPIIIFKSYKEREYQYIKNTKLSIKLINYNNDFKNAVRISYVGDLIMLKDQVIAAKNNITGKYEFDEMFKYTSSHFKKSDLSIGVYEGPSAGNKTSFSTSNYGDGIPLYLNYPDEFAESVKKAGINLVTTANNHLMDKNIEGALRTIDILKKYNITHTGSYKYNEKKNLLILDIKGIKFSILSYTSIVNNWNLENLYEKYSYITNIIPFDNNKYYKDIYKLVKNDFKRAKESNSDYIMVLVHMGTEFNHETDDFQKKWNKIFSDLGADFILGDHAHAIEPLEILGKTFIVNCPGNFANSYIKNNGDATSIVDLYFDKQTKKFLGSSIVPMYTQEYKPKYFRALPIFHIFNDSLSITEKEKIRISDVQKLITKVMLGKEIPISNIKENYFFINGSYIDIINSETKLKKIIKEKYINKEIYKMIDNSYSITFIGDSITEGTKNNYHPWYEPLIYYFKNKKIINISKGSYTTLLIIKNFKYNIIKSKSDLYIIAIGTNDIRYRDPNICSMTKEEYIKNINKIVNFANLDNKKAKFILISPWLSSQNDNASKLNNTFKIKFFEEYSSILNNYCIKNNYLFINPNPYIFNKIKKNITKYLLDEIHPNENEGIELYSEAILNSSI